MGKCRKSCNLLSGDIFTYVKAQVSEFFELGVGDEDLRFATFPTLKSVGWQWEPLGYWCRPVGCRRAGVSFTWV